MSILVVCFFFIHVGMVWSIDELWLYCTMIAGKMLMLAHTMLRPKGLLFLAVSSLLSLSRIAPHSHFFPSLAPSLPSSPCTILTLHKATPPLRPQLTLHNTRIPQPPHATYRLPTSPRTMETGREDGVLALRKSGSGCGSTH